jgi:hypothetical protein
MTDSERLSAIEDIKQVKARYFRGVDSGDPALVRAILADECVRDYNGCCTDPATGRDFLPAMNVVLRGSEDIRDRCLTRLNQAPLRRSPRGDSGASRASGDQDQMGH